MQTTWLALVRSGETIADPQAVAGWLCTAARREAWRVARQSARQQPGRRTRPSPGTCPTSRPPSSRSCSTTTTPGSGPAWSRLPERCQRLLRIVAAEPRPDYSAIAADLDMPVGSIGPTRGRCLEKLRRELVQAGGL